MQEPFGDSNGCTLKFRNLTEEQENDFRQDGEVPPRVNCFFKSYLRHLDIEDIGDPYAFVDDFFKEQNLYVPGIIWSTKILEADDLVLRLEGLSPNVFEGFFCLIFPRGMQFFK